MSRIGKKPIEIPQGVEVEIAGQHVAVKGPRGELSRDVRNEVLVAKSEDSVVVSPRQDPPSKEARAFWGLTRALVANMIHGVHEGYEKKLEIEGVGYRAAAEGDVISLNVGFSHPVKISAPEGVQFSVEGSVITISGNDKEKVGQFAAKIRKTRPPEPYKGKGIRYQGEVVRRKLGKRAAGAGTAGG